MYQLVKQGAVVVGSIDEAGTRWHVDGIGAWPKERLTLPGLLMEGPAGMGRGRRRRRLERGKELLP